MATIEGIKLKVEKLLRMAADREGTPEGETFRTKAFELMADYGVEASHLSTTGSDTQAHAIRKDITLTGTYTDMQYALLNALGTVLHCQVLRFHIPRSSRVDSAVLFGRQHHVERVTMLYSLLSATMIAGATTSTELSPDPLVATTTRKRSWMAGFISEITSRLLEIENAHTQGYTQQTADGSRRSGAMVLLQDKQVAEELARQHFPEMHTRKGRKRTFDHDSFYRGAKEGHRADLGQTRMGVRHGALPRGVGD